jgi:hypothetical protein
MKHGLLRDKYPELRKQWSNKNTLSFDEVTCGSNKKVIWICDKEHEWEARVNSRTWAKRNAGCPFCKNRKATKENSLAALRPKIAKEWDYKKNGTLTPSDVTYASNKIVWWKCAKRKHGWQARIASRTTGQHVECPYCKHKKTITERSLFITHPHLLKEWNTDKNLPLTPLTVTGTSNRKVWWECCRGHEWQAIIFNRAIRKTNCPICKWQTSRLQVFLYCELLYFYPTTLFRHRFDGIECDIYIPELNIGVELDGGIWHKDKVDHDREKVLKIKDKGITLINVRENGLEMVNDLTVHFKRNCEYLIVSKLLIDLLYSITKDERLKQYKDVSFPLNEKQYMDELSRYPTCGRGKTLAEVFPEISKDWDYEKNGKLTPDKIAQKSNVRVWWKCKAGHSWQAPIYSRVSSRYGCSKCHKRRKAIRPT